MRAAFQVGNRLSPAIVREFNLGEWRKGSTYYFGKGKKWWRPEREILRGLDNPTYDVQTMLDAVPAYPTTNAGIRKAWAHHMAIHAGCHAWPNANHRTAMLSFNFALASAVGKMVGFRDTSSGERLVKESHAQRDADGGEYTANELASPVHAYRKLFAKFSKDLLIVADQNAGQLANFGPET
ncbi:MAG: hypothetical protein ACYDBQ_05950 [Thermoplasmatota archaeon]